MSSAENPYSFAIAQTLQSGTQHCSPFTR
jgi:hypothetical protein